MRERKLNSQQKSAVEHKTGPLLIIAGAGTGKTTVITERIKFLIEKEFAKPSEILALTFTDKAAHEMEERVDIAMPFGFTQMWISTFHAFCDRILRREALQIGLDPRYKLMTQADTTKLIRDNLFKFDLDYFRPLGNPDKFVGGLIQHFSRLQDEDISPPDYVRWVRNQKDKSKIKNVELKTELAKWEELASAFKVYEELKVREGRLDFGDLIVKSLKLFRQRPNVLREYRNTFKYILVDEFQDTNIAQNDLVLLLAGKNGNITVVADDDQSIYKWRGAAVSNVLQFKKNYPKTKIITLTKNYRSAQTILDKSYDLIQHNNPDRLEKVEGINKKLISQVKTEGEVVFIHRDRVENEAEAAAKEIQSLITAHKSQVAYGDIAILVRANNHADAFIRAFQRFGIPYQFLGPGRLFKQNEIIDMISYLKVLYDFEDDVSLYRIFSLEYFGIDAKDRVRLSNFARKYNLSLFDAAEKIEELYVSPRTKKIISKLLEIIKDQLKISRKETAGQLLYNFLEKAGLLVKLLNPDDYQAEKRAKNISKFFDKLKTYEVDNEDATVLSVVDWINLAMELGESPLAADIDWMDTNAVNILTIHSAKGLEFPVVFLVNLVGQRFPSRERSEQIPIPEELIKETLPEVDYHTQEERRLFYVGMTRAKERLYLTAADYYGEGKREKKLSPFIFEALGDEAAASEQAKEEGEQLSFLDYKPSDLVTTESQHVTPEFHIDYLSYSQIDTFRICPLHYKLKYILKVPTPVTAAISFGSSIHKTMKDFYESAMSGEKVTEKKILSIYESSWQKEGYTSKNYEKKMYERGEKYLVDYLKTSFDKRVLPEALEMPFTVPLPRRKSTTRPLRIGGKIDRVDVLSDGTVEIVDYKTGAKVPTQAQADNDLQLTFYAIAATSIAEKPLGVKADKIKLSLYFFEEQRKVSTTRTKEELDRAIAEIFEWRDKIEKSEFTCSKHMFCEKCEYSIFCNAEV